MIVFLLFISSLVYGAQEYPIELRQCTDQKDSFIECSNETQESLKWRVYFDSDLEEQARRVTFEHDGVKKEYDASLLLKESKSCGFGKFYIECPSIQPNQQMIMYTPGLMGICRLAYKKNNRALGTLSEPTKLNGIGGLRVTVRYQYPCF